MEQPLEAVNVSAWMNRRNAKILHDAEIASAYRRGQEEMRERATKECKSRLRELDKCRGEPIVLESNGVREALRRIRALPIKEQP